MKKLMAFMLIGAFGVQFAPAEKIPSPQILIVKPKQRGKGVQGFKGYITAADKRRFEWKERLKATVTNREKLSDCTVYFIQPPVLTEAMSLFKGRKYADAAKEFEKAATAFRKIRRMKGNPGALSAFYQMECARKLKDWEQLNLLMGKFLTDSLLHEDHKLQYEINSVVWDAVRQKNWKGLNIVLNRDEWRKRKMPGAMRAQVSYAHALALEGIGKPIEALTAYNNVLVADFAASEELTKDAALNCLRILMDQEDVKTAMKLYSTEDHDDQSNGMSLIKEAIGLIGLWEKFIGGAEKLPKKYEKFLKYPPKGAAPKDDDE